MEQRIQQDIGAEEVQPLPKEVTLGAGSFRVMDQNETELEEKKQLLRQRLARVQKHNGFKLPIVLESNSKI